MFVRAMVSLCKTILVLAVVCSKPYKCPGWAVDRAATTRIHKVAHTLPIIISPGFRWQLRAAGVIQRVAWVHKGHPDSV